MIKKPYKSEPYNPKFKEGDVVRLVKNLTDYHVKVGDNIILRGIITGCYVNRGGFQCKYLIRFIDRIDSPFTKSRMFKESDLELDDSLAQVIYG